jgi:hypothetical protein
MIIELYEATLQQRWSGNIAESGDAGHGTVSAMT